MERKSYAKVTKSSQVSTISEPTQAPSQPHDNNPTTSGPPVHPLLLTVVLSKVLKFTQANLTPKDFSSLRSVCKLWNTEVSTILRQTRELPISRLFTRYPNGLHWKYNLQLDSSCYFRSPYPQTLIFSSLKITGSCKNVRDIKTSRFLAVNGHHIKSLHFSSTLHCSHQTKFLLNILHTWCPNLEILHLSSIHRLSGLFNISKSTDQPNNLNFNCRHLKTLILSIECPSNYDRFPECGSELDVALSDRMYFFIHILRRAHRDFNDLKDRLPQEKSMDNSTRFFNLLQSNIERSLTDGAGGSDHFMFLGTLGHILRFARLQKLVVRSLNCVDESRSLAYFLLHHPSKPLQTLRHLEFGKDVLIGKDIASLQGLTIPNNVLKTFFMDNIASNGTSLEMLGKILGKGAVHLRNLRIGNNCTCCAFKRTVLELPKLPNLKRLVIKHINCFEVDGIKLLGNLPRLERLELLKDENSVGGYESIFMNGFCANFERGEGNRDVRGFALRELRFDGFISSQNIIEMCCGRLGNLERVELWVDCVANFERLLRCMGERWGRVEDVRLSVGMPSRSVYRREMDRCIKVLRDDIRQLKGLKFLDLAFRFRRRKILLPVGIFREGFRNMEGLRSLKLTNFRVLMVDKEEIQRCTAHIPFVSFSEMDYI